MKQKREASLFIASLPILFVVIALILGNTIFSIRMEAILLISVAFSATLAYWLGYTWDEIQEGMIDRISASMPAILTMLCVGGLIAAMIYSGIVPMIIYYGIKLISPKFLAPTAFIIVALVSTVTGSSWASAGTVGVAMVGIASALGVSLPVVAGAVVGGAMFGDKNSPLSDTTNLTATIVGCSVYDHVKQMLWTTVPAAIIAIGVYFFAGTSMSTEFTAPESIVLLSSQLESMYNFNILLLLPPLLIVIGAFKKWPTIPVLVIATLASMIMGTLIQGFDFANACTAIIKGFDVSMLGFEGEILPEITQLLNRGGINSMGPTAILGFIAMAFAGVMNVTKFLDILLASILKSVKSVRGLMFASSIVAMILGVSTGSVNVTLVVTGEMFRTEFVRRGLHPANLSRICEDIGTTFLAILPWSSNGIYMQSTLGVMAASYAPWAIVNYAVVLIGIVIATTGIGIRKLTDEEYAEYAKELGIEEKKTVSA